MKVAVMLGSALALTLVSPANAQDSDERQLVDFAVKTCGAANGAPLSAEALRQRLAGDLPNFAMFCMLYNDAWKRGFDLGIADGMEADYRAFCRGAMRRIIGGGSGAEYEAELLQSYSDPAERVVVAQTCATYKEAFQAGLTYARDVMTK